MTDSSQPPDATFRRGIEIDSPHVFLCTLCMYDEIFNRQLVNAITYLVVDTGIYRDGQCPVTKMLRNQLFKSIFESQRSVNSKSSITDLHSITFGCH